MRKVIAIAAVVAAVLAVMPAHADAAHFQKTVTLESPAVGLYDAEVSTGQWLNRCAASGFSDCIPHNEDIILQRGNIGRIHRCLYTTDPDLAQSSTSGHFGYLIDFGIANTIAGRYFILRTVSAAGTLGAADFDMHWYKSLGNCANVGGTDDQSPTDNPDNSTFSNPGTLEEGRVPGYISPDTNCTPNSTGTGVLPGCPRYTIITLFSGDPNSQVRLTICATSLKSSCPTGA